MTKLKFPTITLSSLTQEGQTPTPHCFTDKNREPAIPPTRAKKEPHDFQERHSLHPPEKFNEYHMIVRKLPVFYAVLSLILCYFYDFGKAAFLDLHQSCRLAAQNALHGYCFDGCIKTMK